MKTTNYTAPHDPSTISACQWQCLKSLVLRHTETSGERHLGHGHASSSSSSSSKRPLPRSRHRHAACCVGDYVYVCCGKDGTSPLKDMWKFHIRQKKWEAAEARGSSLPFLQGHTAVAYKRQILIFGGTFSDSLGDVQLWTYNTDLGHLREMWVEPGAPQPLCRRDHSSVLHNNLMYVYGGFTDSLGASQELWAFNIDEEEWTEVTSLSNSRPSRRYGHSAVVADNAMWVFGGLSGLSPCADLWKYSFLLHQWTKVKGLGSPPCLSGHTACVIHHQMVVVGGNSKGKPLNDVWCFNFNSCTWQRVSSTGVPLPSLAFHTCVTCPSQHSIQQVTDRAASTPHLQVPARHQQLLHPDRFVVRPRTSPSVLEEKSPDRCGGTAGHDGSRETQVMPLNEEFKTVAESSVSRNSFDRLDCRIHVSLTEPLVSASPDTPGFYDSGLPFSPRRRSHTSVEEDFLQQGESPRSRGDVDTLGTMYNTNQPLTGQDIVVSADTEEEPLDVINSSHSPVLKACSQENSTRKGSQQLFWNDLFVEDLESVDAGGLDEVQISYPSKNPFLPAPWEASKSGSRLVLYGSTAEARTEPVSREHYQHRPSRHQSPQRQYKRHPVELQNITPASKDASSVHRVQPVPPAVQAPDCNAGAKIQPELASGALHPHSGQPRELDSETQQCLDSDTAEQPSQKPPQTIGNFCQRCQESNPVDAQLDIPEAETSFIVTGESLSSSQAGEKSNAAGDRLTGKPVHCAPDRLVLPDTGEPEGSRRSEGTETCVREEGNLETFLLVLGGRMEEQGSVHPKPLALWKGVFL